MRKEIVINVEPNETRIGIREDGDLVELMVERSGDRLSVGDIYKARVTAVLPGMQAAFLDIGCEKSAFLHVSDMGDEIRDFESIDDRFEGCDCPYLIALLRWRLAQRAENRRLREPVGVVDAAV